MDELITEIFYDDENEDFTKFFMNEIEVDGIKSNRYENIYAQNMFELKEDRERDIEYVDKDGSLWIDDRSWNDATFSSPYMNVPYRYGEINESLWLEHGVIVGKEEKDW